MGSPKRAPTTRLYAGAFIPNDILKSHSLLGKAFYLWPSLKIYNNAPIPSRALIYRVFLLPEG